MNFNESDKEYFLAFFYLRGKSSKYFTYKTSNTGVLSTALALLIFAMDEN